ncbi:MAG: tRNA preQ1(34) S-adenosylmethionine ribosyltransferase-isomerase QueA [Paracoccaceae bacterium]
MKLSDFDFDLPEQLIATRPARPRSASRLLVATPEVIEDAQTLDLPTFLKSGDRLVLNDTRVIPARLFGTRYRPSTDGPAVARIEVTLLEPDGNGAWRALLKPLRKVRVGETIRFSDRFQAELVGKQDGTGLLQFNLSGDQFDAALQVTGAMPLPPYIAAIRPADDKDFVDYQSVWAKRPGAVAAPTASLHFDDDLLGKLAEIGVGFTHVTLHVGAGTFLPVKVDDISQHKMHSERGIVSQTAADEINDTRAKGGRIIPVGTTALRLLETAANGYGGVHLYHGSTDIFIAPGYRFKVADGLITNFHLPKSTLMMLVSALMGVQRVREIYSHAIASEYRFFSYGDASLLLPQVNSRPEQCR